MADVTVTLTVRKVGALAALVALVTGMVCCKSAPPPGGSSAPAGSAASVGSAAPAGASPSATPPEGAPHEHHDPVPPPADALALLSGLGPGTVMDGWPVYDVAIQNKELVVYFGTKDSGFQVHVAQRGVSQLRPPFETEKYALFYGFVREYGGAVAHDAPEKLANELAMRIRRVEKDVPVPAGM